jgi:hypothetical protein
MAEEVAIGSTGEQAKIRNPVGVVVLSVVTAGIYALVWYYKVNKELAALGRDTGKKDELGDNPMTSLIAVTIGACVIVPAVISVINTWKRMQAARRLAGLPPMSGAAGVVLGLFLGPVLYGYEQAGLNEAFAKLGSGVAATPVPVAA